MTKSNLGRRGFIWVTDDSPSRKDIKAGPEAAHGGTQFKQEKQLCGKYTGEVAFSRCRWGGCFLPNEAEGGAVFPEG